MPDFSFAGYRRGEEPFRVPSQTISVTSFGAKGDGKTDDTKAFQDAIAHGTGKVILVPPGRFVISDVLEIKSSNIVLRGAGPGKTILFFPKSLEELRPRSASETSKSTTKWSFTGGLIILGGNRPESGPESRILSTVNRGENHLTVESPIFKVGDEVVVTVQDDGGKSMVDYLYRGQAGDTSGITHVNCRQVVRIVAMKGQQVTLDRGLRFELRPQWEPKMRAFRPMVTDVGLEGVAIEFPAKQYAGHFKETGFNAAVIGGSAAHCWLKDIKIWNADAGPFVYGTFCTIDGIRMGADSSRLSSKGHGGHHGVTMAGYDCLCSHFDLETPFVHDLSVTSYCMGCVFCSGRAANLNMDHHRYAPYENLFTDIDAGDGGRLFNSGGDKTFGLPTAAGATFWNIRTQRPVAWPKDFGPDAINLVALSTGDAPILDPNGRWLEPLAPGAVRPANLYEAMLKRRLELQASSRGGNRKANNQPSGERPATKPRPTGASTAGHDAYSTPRTWTDASGKFRIEASFAGMAEGKVSLRKSDGSTISIPLEKLSQQDQKWVQQHNQ